jgi:hypothetical protein
MPSQLAAGAILTHSASSVAPEAGSFHSAPARPALRRTFPDCSPCFSRVLQRNAPIVRTIGTICVEVTVFSTNKQHTLSLSPHAIQTRSRCHPNSFRLLSRPCSRLVPLGSSEASSVENLPRLFTMFFEGVAEEGSDCTYHWYIQCRGYCIQYQ